MSECKRPDHRNAQPGQACEYCLDEAEARVAELQGILGRLGSLRSGELDRLLAAEARVAVMEEMIAQDEGLLAWRAARIEALEALCRRARDLFTDHMTPETRSECVAEWLLDVGGGEVPQ